FGDRHVLRIGDFEVLAAAEHEARPQPERFDRRCLVGRMRRARKRLAQEPDAEHLGGLREPELRAILRRRDALHAAFVLARALHGLRDRERENCADRVARGFVEQLAQIAGREAGARGVVHQHPVIGIHRATHGSEAIEHRVAPGVAAAIERVHLAGERAPVLAREMLVVRREHDEHGAHLRHAHCAHRVPEQGQTRDRHILLRRRSLHARAAARRWNEREDGQSCCNSGRYNCTLRILMQRDSPPARRRYTRLAGSADARALARLAQEERPIAVVSATALDAQPLVEEILWFAPQLRVCLLPDWETLPYDQFSPHHDLVSERLATLYRIQRGDFDVAVVPAPTALGRLCPPAYIAAHTFLLRTQERLDLEKLKTQLVTAGYEHVTQVVAPGEVCFRGGLIDLYPMGSALPYRLDLDDD